MLYNNIVGFFDHQNLYNKTIRFCYRDSYQRKIALFKEGVLLLLGFGQAYPSLAQTYLNLSKGDFGWSWVGVGTLKVVHK